VRALRLLIGVACLASLLACAGSVRIEGHGGGHGGDYDHFHSRSCRVPPGHLPPPGSCRIWYPDRPPGHQPPPGDCYALERQVAPGACLVHGD
jgi:hypothetical protein